MKKSSLYFINYSAATLLPVLIDGLNTVLYQQENSLDKNNLDKNSLDKSSHHKNGNHADFADGLQHLWQVCWLNDAAASASINASGACVIGLLPRQSWTVYAGSRIEDCVIENCIEEYTEGDENNAAINNSKNADDLCIHIIKTQRLSTYAYNTYNKSITLPHYHQRIYKSSYHQWQAELINYANNIKGQAQNQTDNPKNNPKNNPCGSYYNGLMGFIGYDISAHQLSPNFGIALTKQPCAFLGHYDIYLQQVEDGWALQSQPESDPAIIEFIHQQLGLIEASLKQADGSDINKASSKISPPPLKLTPHWQYSDYKHAFDKTQEYLYQGDSYQINLTQCWRAQTDTQHNPLPLLPHLPALYQNTQAPFAGYLNLSDFELLSCSPELFLTFECTDGGTRIITKPIKGTRPRGYNKAEDERLKSELADSDKDKAENVMIVDLLRNDLGKYAKVGSVAVPKLFAIESFSNVHHMVSTITADIKDEVHPLTVLFDSLPAGSITGAPKKRAVEIISELEGMPRGAYCGTMGYMNFDGSGQWNVLIRTLQANGRGGIGEVNLWAGGGITVGSDCKAEYQECMDKVGNLLAVLAGEHSN